ncbi:MAG: phosphatase [Hyphomonadaceae bacterium]|nr:phosphatase [Clostridia bacterium]
MRCLADTHCHSLATGHAYSTIGEMAHAAHLKGLELIAITDHGVSMYDAPKLWYFGNIASVPRVLEGVIVLRGVEANIIGDDGQLDMPLEYLKKLDWVIASFHDVCYAPKTSKEHTQAYLGVMQNEHVDVIGHSGNPIFEYDVDVVIRAAKEYGKIMEINNHSFHARAGSEKNCMAIAKKCMALDVPIVVSSDAHHHSAVGVHDTALKMLEGMEFPEHLILNRNAEKILTYLIQKKNIQFTEGA